jgi:putative aminopeptidase FrvX
VDNAYAIDPGLGPGKAVPLGTGPVVRRFESGKPGRGMAISFSDEVLVQGLRAAGKAANLPVHVDARFNLYTDASGAYEAFSDIKCTSLTIPRRYSHSPYEVTHLDSLQNTVTLLGKYFEANWRR